MLDKRNKKLYKSLRGEYKRYARRLKNTLFDCCRDRDAVNDSLSDVLTMLSEAQTSGRAFADVIPDSHAGIRETVLCFPARRIRRNTAVILCLSATLVLLAGSAVAIELSGDVWLSQPVPYYDAEQNIVYWQPVEHAQAYTISVNGSEAGTTDETIFRLEDTPEEFIVIQVTATAGGRYRESSGFVDYRPTVPEELAQERPLALTDRLQEVDVLAERKTLSIPSGWSTYRFLIAREQLGDNFRNRGYFMLYKSTEDALELRRPNGEKVEFHVSHGSLAACDFIFYPGLSETDPFEFIISAFNPSEDAVQIAYEIMPEISLTQDTLAQGTLTLQPGITYVENETSALIMTRAEQEFSAHEYTFLRLESYNLIAAQYFPFEQYAYFFNPYDEPLTLKLTAYSPQTF